MGHADLYTQTSAQTVNNGTHTRTHIVTSQMYSHTHTLGSYGAHTQLPVA